MLQIQIQVVTLQHTLTSVINILTCKWLFNTFENYNMVNSFKDIMMQPACQPRLNRLFSCLSECSETLTLETLINPKLIKLSSGSVCLISVLFVYHMPHTWCSSAAVLCMGNFQVLGSKTANRAFAHKKKKKIPTSPTPQQNCSHCAQSGVPVRSL